MKKIMLNFFTFLFLFSCLVLQAQSETTINDPQGHFSLELGSGWVAEPIKDPHHFGRYAYIQGQNKLANLAAGSEKLQVAMTPLQYAQAFEKNLMSMPQYQRLQMNTVDLKGREAVYLQFSGVNLQTGNKLIFQVYVLVFETTSYIMIFNSQADQFNTLKPVFDRVIQSIQYSSTASKPTESGITFNDPQGRISLQLGSGWTPLPLQQLGVIGRYHYGQSDREQLVIMSEALPQALSPLQYAQTIEKKELSGTPHQKHQEKNENLGGQDAVYQQFSLVASTPNGEKTPLMFEVYYFVIQNTGYRIAFSARESQHSTVKPVVDQVIQSIQYANVPVQKSNPATQPSQKIAPAQTFKDAKEGTIPLEEGQGILHIELPNWIEGAPFSYRILKMNDGTQVSQVSNSLEDTKLPADNYKIVWRQSRTANDEFLLAENIEIKSGQTIILKLNTGLRIVPADWVPGVPYTWTLRDPSRNVEIKISQSLDPQLVPPGTYELWYRQNQSANDETRMASSIEVKPGELTQFELNTGLRIVPADWVPGVPYTWTLRDPSNNVDIRISKTLDPQLVPSGKYELWYRQNQSANDETRMASSIEVKPGELTQFELNTGFRIVPADWVPGVPYTWTLRDPSQNVEIKISQSLDPQLVPPGKYELWYRQNQNANDETRLASSIEIKPGDRIAFDLTTGIKLVPNDPKAAAPFHWVLTNLATNEEVLKVSNTWDPQPISPGRYKLSVRQSYDEQLTEKASDFEIQAGNLVEKKI